MADVKDFERRMAAIPSAVKKAAFQALEKYANQMFSSMKAAVPVDEGTLRDSIRMEKDPEKVRITIRAGGPTTQRAVRKGARNKKTGKAVTYDYARAQEFGTHEMPANPFFWPSYRLFRKPMRAAAKRAMTKAIKSIIQTEEGHDV